MTSTVNGGEYRTSTVQVLVRVGLLKKFSFSIPSLVIRYGTGSTQGLLEVCTRTSTVRVRYGRAGLDSLFGFAAAIRCRRVAGHRKKRKGEI